MRLLALLLLSTTLLAQAPVPAAAALTTLQRADLAARELQAHYSAVTGLYPDTGWWNSANAITAIADYSLRTGDAAYVKVLANTFEKAQTKFPGFLNDYYDDEGWWALGWIRAYDVTHREAYLEMAVSIFHDMAGGWSEDCGGGIWWSKQRNYKNAIANELFLSVAASLAVRRPDGDGLGWAKREWAWFQASGMINADHLVNDGLTAACRNNGRTTWTYNQGVLLGGLAALSKAKGDAGLLRTARFVADSAMQRLVDAKGVLRESCEPSCGEDGTQFKGIFVRNLVELPATAETVRFVRRNAHSLWGPARTGAAGFGVSWSVAAVSAASVVAPKAETPGAAGPASAAAAEGAAAGGAVSMPPSTAAAKKKADPINGSTQSSALDLLNAAARLEK